MDEPAPPPPPAPTVTPPPPPPADGEIEEGEINSPTSCQLSPRGTKRADIDDDDGAALSPLRKQPRMTEGEDCGPPSDNVDLHVIDDIGGSEGEEEGEKEGGEDDDSDWMDTEEIDTLLDEGVKDYQEKKEEMSRPVEKQKIVLIERSQELFDILPEGWVMFTHDSGMPIYLHKASRVITLSRPYFLGPGSARKHDIPLSAIPCLQYRRALDKEKEQAEKKKAEEGDKPEEASKESEAAEVCPFNGEKRDLAKEAAATVIATAEEYRKENSLAPDDVRKYCDGLFQFRTITVKRFKTWKDKRKHHTAIRNVNRPTLPSTTKLITRPVPLNIGGEKPIKKIKEVVLNPVGKSDVCVLHEYVQHALRLQPKFTFAEMENAAMPYSSTVIIDGTKYGTGYGSSKKIAKNEAASKTLQILLPELKTKINDKDASSTSNAQHDLAFFDEIRIDDPRVTELCNKAGQPNPYTILSECMRRNHGLCDMKVECEMKTPKHQKSEFIMRVGKHEAMVVVKNKREGKQLAAQKILQLLHPHVHCWGSLLRLYGSTNTHLKEKKDEQEEEDIDSEESPLVSLRRSPRQAPRPAGRSRVGKRTPAATTVGRALRNKAASQKSAKLQKSPVKSVWQLSGQRDSNLVEFTVMEYGALGEFAEEERVLVPELPVKEESPEKMEIKGETEEMWGDVKEIIKQVKNESIQVDVVKKEVKKEVQDNCTQVKEVEKKDGSTQTCGESREQGIQVVVSKQNVATSPERMSKKSAQTQACSECVDASTGSDRSFAATKDVSSEAVIRQTILKDAYTETIRHQTILKDAHTETVRHQTILKDASTTAEAKLLLKSGTDKGAQTILKGWQSASLDVSVQQSNGSFRVQSLDVGMDEDSPVNRPLRIWFPPTGTDAVCQTDIKGWLDTHMDVITQGEDGSYYLKKSVEHGALSTDLVYRPYRVHRAIQATWVGNQTFHMATQTKWDGSSTFHKATQCPDPQKSEEQLGQSVLYTLDKGCPVGLTPTLNPFTTAPTVTSLLATLGLPSTEDSPLLPVVQTPIMSTVTSTASVSTACGGVQPMDIDTETDPSSSIVVSQTPTSVTAASSEADASSSGAVAANSEGERIITPTSFGTTPVMSFAGYNQFTPNPANPFAPLLPPAGPGPIPMQQFTYIPQYPGMPTGYNFYPGWM